MKYFFITCLLITTIFFSCNDADMASDTIEVKQKERFGKDVANDPGVSFGSYTVKDGNASTYRFAAAVSAFENKEFFLAAGELRQGTADLMTEGQALEGEANTRLSVTVKNLNELAAEVQKGTVKDISRLQSAIALAKLNVARKYVVGLQEYTVNVPMPEANYPRYTSALKAVKAAEQHLNGTTKTKARKLIAASNNLLDRINAGEAVAEADIKAQRAKLEAFMAAHHAVKE